ncbi:MAG: HEPN domain-containing protein [Bacteroidota bacterium]
MISDSERKALIEYRIEQAHKAIKEVEILKENSLLSLAVNRIYYGMFYVLSSLALKHKFKTSKHGQLIGWFNKNFVKEGTIEQKYSKIIQNAFENRSEGDYEPFVELNEDQVQEMFEDMKDFINILEIYIMTPEK